MNKRQIPKPEDFFLHLPLYEVINWEEKEVFNVIKVLYYQKTIDSYCLSCCRESTFKGIQESVPNELSEKNYKNILRVKPGLRPPSIPVGTHEVIFQCARNESHQHVFIFLVSRNIVIKEKEVLQIDSIQKIGQHPSYGDLNIPKIKKYSRVLSKEAMAELVRAIGLASHDVGVGAYVYLRRIFENLIEDAHKEVAKTHGWDEEKYNSSRMKEKIQLLKSELPDFLVDHSGMYMLLSKGVHELSEQECLEHFDTLKIAIELILDEKLEQVNKVIKLEEAKKAIKKAAEKINGKSV